MPGVRRSRPAAATGIEENIVVAEEVVKKRMEEDRNDERANDTCCKVNGVEEQPQKLANKFKGQTS